MGVVRSLPLEQGKVINSINRLLKYTIFKDTDFELNAGGICAGLSALYLLNKSKGTEAQFFATLEKICNLKKEDYAKEQAWITKFTIDAQLAFNPSLYKKGVSQGDLHKIFLKDDLIKTSHGLAMLDVKSLQSTLDSFIHDDEMVYFGGNEHAIAGFKKGGKYHLYDPNFGTELIFDNIADFTTTFKECLFVKPTDQSIGLQIKTFSSKLQPTNYHYPEATDLIKMISKTDDEEHFITLLDACKYGNPEMALALIKEGVADPYKDLGRLTASPFECACSWGNPEVVQVILDNAPLLDKDTFLKILSSNLERNQPEVNRILFDFATKNYPNLLSDNLMNLFTAACKGGDSQSMQYLMSMDHDHQITPQLNDLLKHAVKGNNEKGVRFILDSLTANKIPINQNTLSSNIMLAINEGHYNSFIVLNAARQKFGKGSGRFEFNEALKNNKPRIASYMLGMPDSKIELSLADIRTAFQSRNTSLINVILNKIDKFPPDEQPKVALLKNCLNDPSLCSELLNVYKDKQFIQNLLFVAAENGNTKLLNNLLLNSGIEFETKDNAAYQSFFKACLLEDVKSIEGWVKLGLDVNKRIPFNLFEGQYTDKRAINLCLTNPEAALLLLQAGASINKQEAMDLAKNAVLMNNTDILQELSKRGLDLDDTKINGWSLIDLAVEKGQWNVASFLVQKNVTVSQSTSQKIQENNQKSTLEKDLNLKKDSTTKENDNTISSPKVNTAKANDISQPTLSQKSSIKFPDEEVRSILKKEIDSYRAELEAELSQNPSKANSIKPKITELNGLIKALNTINMPAIAQLELLLNNQNKNKDTISNPNNNAFYSKLLKTVQSQNTNNNMQPSLESTANISIMLNNRNVKQAAIHLATRKPSANENNPTPAHQDKKSAKPAVTQIFSKEPANSSQETISKPRKK